MTFILAFQVVARARGIPMKRTLGLDLGTASVGWALLDVPDEGEAGGQIIALGARIFAEGARTSGGISQTPTQERRQARSMRRQTRRRAERKGTLRREFASAGLLPGDDVAVNDIFRLDPADLLARSAAGDRLDSHEIGRLFYWMAFRRGFLSLRKGGAVIEEDDEPSNDEVSTRLLRADQVPERRERRRSRCAA